MSTSCEVHGVLGFMCNDGCQTYSRELRRNHVCEEWKTEAGSEPRPDGTITLTFVCSICRRRFGSATDRVLP
jgi:hypothetical protein